MSTSSTSMVCTMWSLVIWPSFLALLMMFVAQTRGIQYLDMLLLASIFSNTCLSLSNIIPVDDAVHQKTRKFKRNRRAQICHETYIIWKFNIHADRIHIRFIMNAISFLWKLNGGVCAGTFVHIQPSSIDVSHYPMDCIVDDY